MAKPITIFSSSSGLNTKTDPSRIPFDPSSGLSDLAVAYNVDHDSTGRISRRKGYAATAVSASAHSLWCGKGDPCLFVTGSSLCRLAADFTYQILASVTAGATMRYAQIATRVYCVNGHEVGKVVGGIAQAWTAGTYYGPETKRTFSGPPAGHLICYHRGRLYIAEGPVVWYSEPFSDNLFDLARNFIPFESRLRMIASAGTTIFFSDQTSTFALVGATPHESEMIRVADYPAIEGTEAEINLAKIGEGNLTGMGLIWMSTKGICIGTPQGLMFNLTERKIDIPDAIAGAGAVIGDRYVTLLSP